jgi:hypothetical protein
MCLLCVVITLTELWEILVLTLFTPESENTKENFHEEIIIPGKGVEFLRNIKKNLKYNYPILFIGTYYKIYDVSNWSLRNFKCSA